MCRQAWKFSAKYGSMRSVVGKEPDTGLTGLTVAANVKRLRGEMSYTQLSRRLEERAGWSINPVGIRRIEAGERRVGADDLIALAVALEVSPVTLLMPASDTAGGEVSVTGHGGALTAEAVWHWLRASYPLPGDDRLALVFRAAAWPGWRLKDQIEQDQTTQAAWLAARRDQVKLQNLDTDGDD